jgi:hypothetical protein
MARLASASSTAVIWAKSCCRSTSLPDIVSRASMSIIGLSSGGRCFSCPSNSAWLTRVSPAFSFSRCLFSIATGENSAIIFSTRSRVRQNSRKAWSKTS